MASRTARAPRRSWLGRCPARSASRRGDGFRIVWYFDARVRHAPSRSRTPCAVAVAYDDVVDVNLKVWGDQWDAPLDRLVAIERARPHPPRLGQARLGARGRRAHRAAGNAPRRLGSRSPVRRAADAHPALRLLLDARHEGRQGMRSTASRPRRRPTRRPTSQDQEQIDRLKAHPLLVAAIVLALRTSGAARHRSCVLALRPGAPNGLRSRVRAGPPTDTEPALVPAPPGWRGRARTSSRRRCSTSFEEASTSPSRRRPSAPSGAVSDLRRCRTSSSRPEPLRI